MLPQTARPLTLALAAAAAVLGRLHRWQVEGAACQVGSLCCCSSRLMCHPSRRNHGMRSSARRRFSPSRLCCEQLPGGVNHANQLLHVAGVLHQLLRLAKQLPQLRRGLSTARKLKQDATWAQGRG